MRNTTTLTIPIDESLKKDITDYAKKMGFSSVQSMITSFLTKMIANKELTVPTTVLSTQNENRYKTMVREVKEKKVETKTFTNSEDLLTFLKA